MLSSSSRDGKPGVASSPCSEFKGGSGVSGSSWSDVIDDMSSCVSSCSRRERCGGSSPLRLYETRLRERVLRPNPEPEPGPLSTSVPDLPGALLGRACSSPAHQLLCRWNSGGLRMICPRSPRSQDLLRPRWAVTALWSVPPESVLPPLPGSPSDASRPLKELPSCASAGVGASCSRSRCTAAESSATADFSAVVPAVLVDDPGSTVAARVALSSSARSDGLPDSGDSGSAATAVGGVARTLLGWNSKSKEAESSSDVGFGSAAASPLSEIASNGSRPGELASCQGSTIPEPRPRPKPMQSVSREAPQIKFADRGTSAAWPFRCPPPQGSAPPRLVASRSTMRSTIFEMVSHTSDRIIT
mmetsp:Transcript_41965/g.97144  ORF Transcript_41965/g.97144 Transcript_41965/m.97144 type:complete len:359 (+) Transcript_41965:1745-2821(+)